MIKLKLLYDVELTKRIGSYPKAKHFFFNRIILNSTAIDINLNIYIYIYIYFFFFATWKMINPIHITKLKLLYDVELTIRIGDYQKAKHFFFFFKE